MNARSPIEEATVWLKTAVANNPEGLLLLAAGGVLLMRKGNRDRRATRLGGASVAERSIPNQPGSATDSITASASKYAREAKGVMTDASGYVIDKAQSAFDSRMSRALREQPLLIAVAGFAAGATAAALFPPTNLEQQTLGPIGEQLSQEASRIGEHITDTASKAASTLKTAAQQHILETDGVKKIVSEVTEVVRDGMESQRQNSGPPSSAGDQNSNR